MVRLELSTQLSYEVLDAGCDFIFSIQAAHTSRQKVGGESLQLSQNLPVSFYTDPARRRAAFCACAPAWAISRSATTRW